MPEKLEDPIVAIKRYLKDAAREMLEQYRRENEADDALIKSRPRPIDVSFAARVLQAKRAAIAERGESNVDSVPMQQSSSGSSASEVDGAKGRNFEKYDTFSQRSISAANSLANSVADSTNEESSTSTRKSRPRKRVVIPQPAPINAPPLVTEPPQIGPPTESFIVRPRKRLRNPVPTVPIVPYQHVVHAKYTPIPSYDFVVPVATSRILVDDPVTYHTMPSYNILEGWEAKERSVLRYTWEQLTDIDTNFLDDHGTNPHVRDPFYDKVLFKTCQKFLAKYEIKAEVLEEVAHVHEIPSDETLVAWLLNKHDNKYRADWTPFLLSACQLLEQVLGRPVVEIMDNYRVTFSESYRRKHVEGLSDTMNSWKELCPIHLVFSCPHHGHEDFHKTFFAGDKDAPSRRTRASSTPERDPDEPCSPECYKMESHKIPDQRSFQEITAEWNRETLNLFNMCMVDMYKPNGCTMSLMIDGQTCEQAHDAILAYSAEKSQSDIQNSPEKSKDAIELNVLSARPSGSKLTATSRSKNKKTKEDEEQDYMRLEPSASQGYEPCMHPGQECGNAESCACATNRTWCDKFCGCPPSCTRRFKGCYYTCHHQDAQFLSKDCASGECPCFQANRECDPELCCGRASTSALCRNMQLQRAAKKRNYVGVSEVEGYGLYLGEDAVEGDLVQEYTGEYVIEQMASLRAVMYAKRRKTYFYELHATAGIDSEHYGNRVCPVYSSTRTNVKTRYINAPPNGQGDRPKEPANCVAAVKYVLGENRIGVYLSKKSMKAGEELLMDYGEMYEFSAPA